MSVPIPPRIAAQGAADAARTKVGGVTAPDRTSISGTVVTSDGRPLPNVTVQARNLMTGRVGGSAMTGSNGQFAIAGLDPGNYVLEVVDGGQVVGTSAFISAPAGTTPVTTVTVMSGSRAAGPLSSTAAKSVIAAAVAAGVSGVVVAANVQTASPSR
jgi:hypothetical protein